MTSNTNNFDPSSGQTGAPVNILGINMTLPQVSTRDPSVKLTVDGHTISKQSLTHEMKLDWELNEPYALSSGKTLTIHLRERHGWLLHLNETISTWNLSYPDAVKAVSLSAGQKIEYKISESPSVILVMSSTSPEHVPSSTPHQETQSGTVDLSGKVGSPTNPGQGNPPNKVDLTEETEVLSKRRSVLDHLGETRTFLETLLTFGTVISEINPIASLVLASVNELYGIFKEQEVRNARILDLVYEMALTIGYVEDMDQFARLPQLVKAMKEVEILVKETKDFVQEHSSHADLTNTLVSTVSSSSNDKLDDLSARFTQFKAQFDRGLAVQSTINTEKIDASVKRLLETVQDDKTLEVLKQPEIKRIRLPEPCMDNTRQDIITEAEKWGVAFDTPNILWIKGYPGVGKSAIASKLVERFGELKRLGSSFFFDRANSTLLNPHTLWLTVAYDLAQNYPTIRRHLVTKIQDDLTIAARPNVETIFRELIHPALVESKEIPVGRLPIVVLDALDECGGLEGRRSGDRSTLIRSLVLWSKLPRQYQLVVTSRGERDLEDALKGISQVIDIKVGSNASHQSLVDIQAFLSSRLKEVTAEYPQLVDWPGTPVIRDLAMKASGQFIWAKVAVDFISHGDPEERLAQISGGAMADDRMSALYSTVLENAFRSADPEDVRACHDLLGAVVTARAPLSQKSIEDLLGIKATRIQRICNELKSVLESGEVLRIIHQSFTDFLINKNVCSPTFWIGVPEEERRLALACLREMKLHLQFNICQLESSYRLNSEVEDIESRIKTYIPTSLQYSCWYWVDHLVISQWEDSFLDEVLQLLDDFMRKNFLFWLEILSLTKRVNIASRAMLSLDKWLQSHHRDNSMAADLHRFCQTFANAISQSAPHIYISALPFAPQNVVALKDYQRQYPGTLGFDHGGLEYWPNLQFVMHGHRHFVRSVAFSLDGTRVVSGSFEKTIRIWDAETGEPVGPPLKGHTGPVNSVVFSPNGSQIASGSSDNTVRIWIVATGEPVGSPLQGHDDSVNSVAFSPDGSHIVSGSLDKTVRVWDAATGEQVGSPLLGHTDFVYSVAFSPDGSRIVSGSVDGTMRIWDKATGELIGSPLQGHASSVAFSPDGTRIVSGSWDQTVRIWNVTTGDPVGPPLQGHTNEVNSVAFSPDGSRIVSGSSDNTVRIWNVDTGESVGPPLRGHTGDVNSVGFSPDGSRIVSGSSDKTVRIWDLETGESVDSLLQGHTDTVNSIFFSLDGTRIISGSLDGTVRTWDAVTGESVGSFPRGNTGPVTSFSFLRDGSRIVSGSWEKTVTIWDLGTGEPVVPPLEGHTDAVYSVTVSPDGSRIVSGSSDKTVRIWNTATGESVGLPLQGHTETVNSVAFSPDGSLIVSGSRDTTMRIWNVATGELVRSPLQGHDDGVTTVAFSPDGTYVVSGSSDRTLRIWNAATGEPLGSPLQGHKGSIESVAFSPDGSHIVSGSWDTTIRIWDTANQKSVGPPLRGHTAPVESVAFSPDGTRIVSGSRDRTLRVWDLDVHKLSVEPYEQDGANTKLVEDGSVHLGASAISNPMNNSSSFTDGSEMVDGWILNSKSEHLFWVPPTLHPGLLRPSNPFIIGDYVSTKLNLEKFKHGKDWIYCRGSA